MSSSVFLVLICQLNPGQLYSRPASKDQSPHRAFRKPTHTRIRTANHLSPTTDTTTPYRVPRTPPRERLLISRWKFASFAPGKVRLSDSFRTRVTAGRTQARKVGQVVREAHPTPVQFRLPLTENPDGCHEQLPALAQGAVVQMQKLQKFGRRWRRGDQRPVQMIDRESADRVFPLLAH